MGVLKGKKLEVIIETTNSRGQGITRLGEGRFVLFVSGALPGERIRGKVTVEKRSYGIMELEKVIEPNPGRVVPRCPWFGICGGCALQHASYGLQKDLKRQSLDDAIKRIAGIRNFDTPPCEPSPVQWGYRNKASFPVSSERSVKSIGFFREGSHDLVPIDVCPVLEPGIESLISPMSLLLKNTTLDLYDEKRQAGCLRHIVVRSGDLGRSLLIVPVLNRPASSNQERAFNDFSRSLFDISERIGGVVANYNAQPGNTIFGRSSRPILGKPEIIETLGPFSLKYGPTSFFQVNTRQAGNLFKAAVEILDNYGIGSVLELYCGTGALTLFLARKGRKVCAVEEWPESVSFLRINAENNDLSGSIEMIGTSAETAVENLSGRKFDAVVMDPPRKGCSERVLMGLKELAPSVVVYISCNPATLARDCAFLVMNGYRLKSARPFDMFPQTFHVESIAVFEKQ